MSSKKKQKQKDALAPPIPPTKWPEATPSVHEEKIVSVVCGNTHLHWAFHNASGADLHFAPTLFWRTPQLSEEEVKLAPAVALSRHIPEAAHDYIFGHGAEPTKEMAIRTGSSRRVPILSVYVISTNDEQAERLNYLWKDVPSRIYMMQGDDFFTKEQGRYDGMGVDRLAELYAAANIYGFPALVFDGGTAMTYTAADADGKIMGGGITLGMGGKLRSLADFTGALPHIHPEEILRLVSQAESGNAFPVFAKDTKKGILVSVLSEVAHSGRNIIKHWLKKVGPAEKVDNEAESGQKSGAYSGQVEEMKTDGLKITVGESDNDGINRKRTILVTGGDADILLRLLEPNHSGVVQVEPGDMQVPTAQYDVQKVKHMIHYGIGALLEKKIQIRISNPFVDEWDTELIGQRVAKEFPVKDADGNSVYRGTVTAVNRGETRDKDFFLVRYDDDDTEELSVRELYDSLILYSENGEKSSRKTNGLRETEKTVASKAAAAMIKENVKKFKSTDNDDEVAGTKRAATESAADKAAAAPASKRSKKPDPRSYLQKRIAKYFGREVFFGDIVDYEDSTDEDEGFWHIAYDDGDSEDLVQAQVDEGLELYEQRKYDDTSNSGAMQASAGISTNEVGNSTEKARAPEPVEPVANDSKGMEKLAPVTAPVVAPVAAPVVTPAETENKIDGEASKPSEQEKRKEPVGPSQPAIVP